MQNSSYQGRTIKTKQGFDVTLTTLLGEGATAYTYLAKKNNTEDYVAVKIAKLGQNDFLEGEYKVLEAAREYYLKTKGEDLIQPSPTSRGDGKFEEQYFIVMEYLTEKPALHVLNQKKKLSEEQVLSYAVELFEFLDFLHTDRNVTYSDFKFDNLRLNDNTNRLRILDLGGLVPSTDINDPKRKRDVLVMASTLFTLLSGADLQLFAGEVTEGIEAAIKDESFKENVSWGTFRFFSRLLARVSEFRFDTARSAADEAKELFQLWELSESDLLGKITEYAALAKDTGNAEERNIYLAKQRTNLSVFVNRFGKTTPISKKLNEDLEETIKGTSFLENGKTDLRYGHYHAAIKKFREGETFENNPSQFRRWQYLAHALEQFKDSPALLSFSEEIVDLFENKKYREVLDKTGVFPESAHIDELKQEAKIYLSYQTAAENKSNKQFEMAVEEYSQTEKLLSTFKYRNAVEKEKGNPQKLAEECRRAQEEFEKQGSYEKFHGKIKASLTTSKQFDYDDLRQFVSIGKFSSKSSSDSEKLIELALDNSSMDYVSVLAETLFWGIAFKSDTLRNLYSICCDLAYLRISIDSNRFGNELEIFKKLAGESKNSKGITRQITTLIKDMIKKNYAAKSLDFWKGIKSLPNKADKGLMAQIKSQIKQIQNQNRRFNLKPQSIYIGISVLAVITVVAIFWPRISASVTPEMTATFTPSATPSPTRSPSPTPTFTPTLAPTPLPTSAFMISGVESLFDPANLTAPKLPVLSQGIWKLPAFTACPEDNTRYCSFMDVPLEDGTYGIYVHQYPQLIGGSSQPVMPFEVLSKSIDNITTLIMPSSGPGKIQLASLNEISIYSPPVPTTWVWVGNYELNPNGQIIIKTGPFEDLSKINPAKVFDQILLVKLNEAQWNQLPPDPDGYKLVILLDDTNIYPGNLSLLMSPITLSDFWNGTGAIAPKEKITFTGSGVLQPGTYKAIYHITGQGFGEMNIKIRTGTGNIEGFESGKAYQILPNNPWLSLGDFTLLRASQVLFEVTNNDPGINMVPVDVILIYQEIIP
ncbi:MAG: hypothetical protein Q8L68_02295 [Methylococcales bacterium]|nr:hypothetical protein [Methylococcales bacterium]